MTTFNISTDVLRWAAGKLSMTVDGLAEEMASAKKLDRFKSGMLTATQAEQLAARLQIPFGYLFLKTPPTDVRPEIPDLRQTAAPEPLSPAFFEALKDIERKVAWFAQHLRENDIPGPAFVGRFRGMAAQIQPEVVARDIVETIGLTPANRAASKTHEGFYSFLAKRFEEHGVLVFRSGVAKGNPHRPLPVSEFRGFAISNPLVPVVFTNGRDSPAAWIFTLMHEAAHIWLGESGVSDMSASNDISAKGIEALCNQVAAEVLTPREEFLSIWKDRGPERISEIAKHFMVSRLVVARRALDFRFIEKSTYQDIAAASMVKKDTPGGNPYATIPIRSSRRFTETLLNSAMVGETLLREAGKLLNIKPDTVVELHRRQKNGGDHEEEVFA